MILDGLGVLTRVALPYIGVTAEQGVRLVLHTPAADAFMALLREWILRGRRLHINRMWSSVEDQRQIRLRKMDLASKPGWSMHPWAMAVDYNTAVDQLGGGTNAEFQVLAAQHGFMGIDSEPWHIHSVRGFDGQTVWGGARSFIEALAAACMIDADAFARALWGLGFGCGHEEVLRFQRSYGFKPADVDGVPGPQTQATVSLITACRKIETSVMDLYGNG